jgi:hypothetical protein
VEALRAGGVEVWLDTSELRGGDVWGPSYELVAFGRNIGDARFCVNAGTLPPGVESISMSYACLSGTMP